MAVIGSLTVKLGLVTVEWDKATAQAKKQAKDLQAAMKDLGVDLSNLQNLFRNLGGAAGLSLAGLGAMSNAIMDMAGQVNDLSASYDISVGKILQFQKAIVMAGGKAEDANTILGTLFTKISSAQEGNDAVISQFEQLGISFEELKQSSPEQLIKRVYDGLNGIGNTYERIKAVREILGKAGLGKSLEDVSRILGESTKEFDRQALALKKWDDMGDALGLTLQNLKLAFAEMLAPFTTDLTINANQFKSAMVAITAVGVVGGMFKLVAAFKALNTALKTTAALSLAINSATGIKGIAMAGAGLAAYFGAKAAFDAEDEEAPTGETAPETAPSQTTGSQSTTTKTGGTQAAQMRVRIAQLREMLDIDRRRNEYQLMTINGSQDELKLAESRLKYEEEVARIKQEAATALSKENLTREQIGLIGQERNIKLKKAQQDYEARDALINAQREKAIRVFEQETEFIRQRNAMTENGLLLENQRQYMTEFQYERAKEQLALEQKLLQIEQDRARLAATRTDKLSPEFVNEMQRLDNAEQAAKREAELRLERISLNEMEATSWSAGWEKALREFSKNAENYGKAGEAAFSSVVGNMNSAIDNFVRTGKFSFKDLAKSIIQDLIAIQLKAQAAFLFQRAMSSFGFTMKAGGGAVSQNIPYLVGENGPELFVPQTGGAIIPNERMSGAGGIGGQTINYNGPYIQNMSAIDTQTATQFLAKNKMAVWSANQSATRSLPQSR